MALLIEPHHHINLMGVLDEAFRLRRKVFVEGMGWKIPGDDGIRDCDQFDDEYATHLLSFAPDGRVAGYLRILPGDRPMLITEVFADTLDMKPAPRGPNVREDSRLCTSLELTDKAVRMQVQQDIHVSHLEYCISRGVETVIVYTSMKWIANTARTGLEIEMLGTPRMVDGELCAPACFHITDDVKALVKQAYGDNIGFLQDPDKNPSLLDQYGQVNVAA